MNCIEVTSAPIYSKNVLGAPIRLITDMPAPSGPVADSLIKGLFLPDYLKIGQCIVSVTSYSLIDLTDLGLRGVVKFDLIFGLSYKLYYGKKIR